MYFIKISTDSMKLAQENFRSSYLVKGILIFIALFSSESCISVNIMSRYIILPFPAEKGGRDQQMAQKHKECSKPRVIHLPW